ncbi:SH3 domain-binding protein 5-like isoform X2 [Cinclus cinclus]|uniref:SH3 domain-binding protein 5-like isoform X2 n=1 Tax=Cinclus cinclus TaxID=127875 RepID=UPI002E11AD23
MLEMVFVAEQGMGTGKNRLDPTWQEMLNHATRKVNEAEQERLWSEREHQRVTRLCQEAEAEVQRLQKSLRRDIARSRPYFELKAQFNQRLEEHKSRVNSLESAVSQAKLRYSVALRNLEQISEEIHARRFQRILRKKHRENPLGAEGGSQNPEIPGIAGKISGIPGEISGIPGNISGIPEEISGIPGGIPGKISGNPNEICRIPSEIHGIPGIPGKISGIPEEISRIPGKISGISGEIRGIPGIPSEIHGIPEEIPGIPGDDSGTGGIPAGISDSGDSLSVLSLQTIASDLQKFDSVEHLSGIPGISGIPDALSLHSEELGEGREKRRNFRHHRSVSL